MTIAPSKTVDRVLLALTQQTSPLITPGTELDVSGLLSARVFWRLGRTIATALGNQVKFRLEASFKVSGNDAWVPIRQWQSTNGTITASSSTVNDAAFNAGDTTFVITSASGIAAGDILYLRETGTPANSEWVRVASVSGTTITLEEAVTRNHTNGINVADQGEMDSFIVNIESVKRLRVVVDTASAASGQTVDVLVALNSLDNFTV